ncbi:hypothetical protein, partial [Desertihabitans aurantiacus]|uniref:hypothetical protein n=1 Tax=Desertihabitans aurantiacus TaxID=2282477 RepID=UPI0038B9E7AC
RTVVRRSAEMRRPPRQALLDDLARQVYPRLSPPPPRPLTSEELLVAVVAERRDRARDRVRRSREGVPTAEQLPAGWR